MQREIMMASAAELRFADGAEGVFEGYASRFGEPDSFGDTIKPGAFRKTIKENKSQGGPAMYLAHDPSEPIGVWDELAEDDNGLKVRGRLADTAKGRDALTLMKMKALTGLSIGFRARQTERGPNGGRVLTDVEIVEISLTAAPAARKARIVSVRSDAVAGLEAFTRAAREAASAIRGTND